MNYERHLARLVTKHLVVAPPNTSMAPLLWALGLRTPRLHAERLEVWHGHRPIPPEPQYEDLVARTIVHALRVFAQRGTDQWLDVFPIIEGLVINGRWRACLETLDDAYYLVTALKIFGARHGAMRLMETERSKLQHVLAPCVCEIVNAWVKPEHPFEGRISTGPLVRAMFGSDWHQVVADEAPFWKIYDLVLRHRPRFLPGLLPEHFYAAAEPLPHLDFYAGPG
jgi:hypothetical protein